MNGSINSFYLYSGSVDGLYNVFLYDIDYALYTIYTFDSYQYLCYGGEYFYAVLLSLCCPEYTIL